MTTRQFVMRVMKLGYVQFVGATFFISVFVVAIVSPSEIPYQYATVVGFLLGAISYILVLVLPIKSWFRLGSVVFPTAAAGGRMLDMFLSHPIRWTGFLTWGFVGFMTLFILPDFLPPEMKNGERRAWLGGNGVG